MRENHTVICKSDQIIATVIRQPKIAIIVSFFLPSFEIEELIQQVADALSNANPDYQNGLFGDFNCRIDLPKEKQETLFDFLQDNSFICCNTPELPTYISHNGKSTNDMLFTNKLDLLKDCELIDCPLPKHSQISGTINRTLTRRSKMCPRLPECDPIRLANNLEV